MMLCKCVCFMETVDDLSFDGKYYFLCINPRNILKFPVHYIRLKLNLYPGIPILLLIVL